MFRKIVLALSAAATLATLPAAAEARGYHGGYGYAAPAYGYNYGYPYPSYGYSYPSYGYSNYGYGYPAYGYSNGYYGYNGYNGYGNSNVGPALVGGVIGLAIGSAIASNHHHDRYYRRHR